MQFKVGFIIASVATLACMPLTASAHDNGYNHRHQGQSHSNGDDQLVGGVIGAIAGGVIGSQLVAITIADILAVAIMAVRPIPTAIASLTMAAAITRDLGSACISAAADITGALPTGHRAITRPDILPPGITHQNTVHRAIVIAVNSVRPGTALAIAATAYAITAAIRTGATVDHGADIANAVGAIRL